MTASTAKTPSSGRFGATLAAPNFLEPISEKEETGAQLQNDIYGLGGDQSTIKDLMRVARGVSDVISARPKETEKIAADKKTKPSAAPVVTGSVEQPLPRRRRSGALKTGRLKPVRAGGQQTTAEAALQCPECRVDMRTTGSETKCPQCGLLTEGSGTPENVIIPPPSRLRVVGPESSYYQPCLDRNSDAGTGASQQKSLFIELQRYRDAQILNRGKAPPVSVCRDMASRYAAVQQVLTKRSQGKSSILASMARLSCVAAGVVPSKREISEFMGLRKRGTARGDNYLRMLKSEGLVDISPDVDTHIPRINTAFRSLGKEGPEYDKLKKAVHAVVLTAEKATIGNTSILETKVIAATLAILIRHAKKHGLAMPSTTVFYRTVGTRKTTADRFLADLKSYHSRFVDIYREADVCDDPSL